jgi:beta-galactosidase
MLALRILGAAAAGVLAGSLFLGCGSILGIQVVPTDDGAVVDDGGGTDGTGSGDGGVGDDGGGTDGTSSGDAAIPMGPGDASVPGNPLKVPPPPPNNRVEFNFNYQWKFIAADAPGPWAIGFDDSTWTGVSLPHTFNDVDQWVDWTSFLPNEKPIVQPYSGLSWYRKHFELDASYKGRKVFLEFQGIRDMGTVFVNGIDLGFCEDEISPCGIDITSKVQFGADNVVAVQVNNNDLEKDQTYVPGYVFDWSTASFYPMYGGLYTDAKLIITDPIHQTLPLWRNLQTSGVYVYASDIDTLNKNATAHVEAEVYNESATASEVTLSVDIYDYDGKKVLTQAGTPQSVAAGMKTTLAVAAPMTAVHFWAPEYPYLYTVRSSLSGSGSVLDVTDNPLGIRTLTFSATNGFKINGHSYWLAGFSPYEVMDWPGTGIPQDWMTEYDYLLMKQANHFFVQPMHVAPRKHMVESADRLGIVMVVPAGDSEFGCYNGAGNNTWLQHPAVMQNVMIYFRNNPSVTFYEGCNSPLTASQLADMKGERDWWDPHGGRFVGARDYYLAVPYEYLSFSGGVGKSTTTPGWTSEYAGYEAPRRVWDKYTPAWDPRTRQYVTGGYVKIASPTYAGTLESTLYNGIAEYPLCDVPQNSMEDQALCNLLEFWQAYSASNFVEPVGTRTSAGIQIGASKVLFADDHANGYMKDTDVARLAGVVDGARLPKSAFYAMRVAASLTPDIAILGHWNYPAGTTKTVYVIASCGQGAASPTTVTLGTYRADGMTLIRNYAGAIDMSPSPSPPWGGQPGPNHYAWGFPNVAFQQGVLKAAATCGSMVVTDQKVTTGPVAALKLTPRLGPKGWFADGADVAMIDVEAVDSNGLRVPTDEASVTFTHSGEGVWIGGYNSGVRQSTYWDNLWTENGINRVFVRSTTTAGTYTVTASRPGLSPVTIYIASSPFPIDPNGLTQGWSQRYDVTLGTEPTPIADPN